VSTGAGPRVTDARHLPDTYIPLGVEHRLEYFGRLRLEWVEEPSGSYLGENDIMRFEDVYGRELGAALPWRYAKLSAGKRRAGPDHGADEDVESPDDLQMPMINTPMQAPSDIPRMNTSMVHSPLWTLPVWDRVSVDSRGNGICRVAIASRFMMLRRNESNIRWPQPIAPAVCCREGGSGVPIHGWR